MPPTALSSRTISRAPCSSSSSGPGPRSSANRSSVGRASSPSATSRRLEDLAGDLARLDERSRAAERTRQLDRRSGGGGEVGVGHLGDGVDREPLDAREIEVDVVPRQPELVEIGAHRGRREPVVPQIADRRVLRPLRELLAVLAEEQPVVDHLRQLTAERPRDPLLHLLVRPVVGAADDVGDAEVEVVDDGRELVGGRAVGARQRRARRAGSSRPDPARAPGVERDRRRLGMPLRPLALPDRPLLPRDPEPAEIGEDRLLAARHRALGIGVVDAQHERAPVLVGVGAVGGRAEGVPEVERPRRARREADADGVGLTSSIAM